MTILRDIQQAQKAQLETRQPLPKQFPAIIVSIEGSVHPNNRRNYTWVLEQGKRANIVAVLNLKVASVEGLEVLVQESQTPSKELEIVGIYTPTLDQNANNGANFNIPNHRENHEFRDQLNPPIDPVMNYLPSMGMLKSTTNGDLTITVLEHTYINDGNLYLFTGEILDLSSYVPLSPNRQIVVLVALDIISNTIILTSGIETNTILPLDFPIIPINVIPSSFITLVTGQTIIDSIAGDVTDSRDFLQIVNRQLLAPESPGDVLISHDGNQWSRGIPLSDNYGEIILDSEGVIITTL